MNTDANSSGYRRSAVISWTIILLSVGFVVLAVNVLPSLRRSKLKSDDASDNMELRSATRFAVGSNAIVREFSNLVPQKRSTSHAMTSYLDGIDRAAKSDTDRVRAAIVAGELDGAAAAQSRLEPLKLPDDDQLQTDVASLMEIYSRHADQLDDAARQSLIDHHAWYGRLALAFGKADSDPQRSQVIDPALHAAAMMYVLIFVVLGALIIGVILLIITVVLVANRKVRKWFAPVVPALPRAVYLESFALYLLLFIVVFEVTIGLLVKSHSLSLSMLATVLLPLALWWPVWRGATWRESRFGFGWHLGPGAGGFRALREISLGIVGYIIGLPLLAVAFLVSTRLSRWAGVTPTHPIIKEFSAGGWHVAQIYVLACVWAPIMEETMFRGALFNHLRGHNNWLVSSVTVGVLFAAIHPQGWTFIPVLGTIGLVLCGIREWRGGIVASMTAHALNNFIVVTLGVTMLGK